MKKDMVRKGSANMGKEVLMKRDKALFNGIVLLLLTAAILVLLCFLNN